MNRGERGGWLYPAPSAVPGRGGMPGSPLGWGLAELGPGERPPVSAGSGGGGVAVGVVSPLPGGKRRLGRLPSPHPPAAWRLFVLRYPGVERGD